MLCAAHELRRLIRLCADILACRVHAPPGTPEKSVSCLCHCACNRPGIRQFPCFRQEQLRHGRGEHTYSLHCQDGTCGGSPSHAAGWLLHVSACITHVWRAEKRHVRALRGPRSAGGDRVTLLVCGTKHRGMEGPGSLPGSGLGLLNDSMLRCSNTRPMETPFPGQGAPTSTTQTGGESGQSAKPKQADAAKRFGGQSLALHPNF